MYTLGHLRARGERKVFPLFGAAEEDSVQRKINIIGHRDGYRRNTQTFDYNGITEALDTAAGGGREQHTAIPICVGGIDKGNKKFGKQFAQQDRVYDGSQVATSLTSQLSGNVNNYAIPMFGIDKNIQGTELECANALTAREDRGVSNFKQTGTAVAVTVGYDRGLNEITSDAYPTCNARDYKGVNFRDLGAVCIPMCIDPQGRTSKEVKPSDTAPTLRAQAHGNNPEICIPVLTPDRAEKRQNGRRFKDNGEEAFTLTAQDKHGVALKIREATTKGYAEAEIGDSVNLSMPESKTRRGRVGKKQANTLDTSCKQGVVVPVIWYEKYKCYIAIRKLTPKECFRLQGWTDDYFERAQFVNSDSQLYKQAGNGVTVNVVEDIARAIG